MNATLLWTIVAIYLLIVAGLAYMAGRRTKSDKDYLIAGGEMHPYVMALAYGSTFISTSAIVGFGGAAGQLGLGLLWLTFLNIFVGIFLAFVVYGKRTLAMGHNLEVRTFAEYLAKRYDSRFIHGLSAVVIFLLMPVYAAAVLIGGARFMEGVLGMNYSTALIILSLITVAYVMWGGLKGVFYNDAFQGTIMFVGMAILLVWTYVRLGGVIPAHQAVTDMAGLVPEALQKAGHRGWTAMPAFGSNLWWTMVTTIVMGVGIGVLAQPQLVLRYLTVKGGRELNRALAMGGVFILMMTGVAFTVGGLSNAYFYRTAGKIAMAVAVGADGKPNTDLIIPAFIESALPQWFGYLFLIVMLAAAMSTLSGQFHVMGAAITRDLYQGVVNRGLEVRNSLTINRTGTLVAFVITVYLGYRLPGSIIAIATAFFMGTCAVTFLPAYTAGLYWKRATRAGAVASVVSGLATVLFLLLFVHAKEAAALGLAQALFGRPTLWGFPWTVVDPLVIGLPISTAVLIVVSLLTRPMEEKHVRRCFQNIGGRQAAGQSLQA